jgi:hypothetical protein
MTSKGPLPVKRRCCCTCEITTDDFDRSDSSTIGSQWTEHAGDWEIDSNKLTATTSPAMIRNHYENPFLKDDGSQSNNQVVSAKIMNYVDGTKYRIVAQSDDTGSSYYFAEWEYVNSSNMYFRLGLHSGGVDTILGTIGPEVPIPVETRCTLSVTDKGQLCQSDSSSRQTICAASLTGRFSGLASGSSVGATFDDFLFSAHLEDKDSCPACDCSCDGYCVPNTIAATYEAINDCPSLDGYSVELVNDGPTKFGDGWEQAAAEMCPGVDLYELIQIKMTCGGPGIGVDNFVMTIITASFTLASCDSGRTLMATSRAAFLRCAARDPRAILTKARSISGSQSHDSDRLRVSAGWPL